MFMRKSHSIIVMAALWIAAAVPAHANLLQTFPVMGDLMRWGVFALGGDITMDNVGATGNVYIKGDVGVAGNGNVTTKGNVTMDGDLWYRSNGKLTVSGNVKFNGAIFHSPAYDSQLDNGVSEAINTSNQAWALPVTPTYAGITDITGNQNITLTGAPGQTVVLRLNNFTLTSGSLTLQGTATTTFVINVSKQFSMTNHSTINLVGGVAWDDVLFNIRGTGKNATMDGGSTFRGVLMANNRTVSNAGQSTVYGEIVADNVSLSGGAQVIHPPVTSP